MRSAVRSELTRLRQPRLLLAWFGLMALFAVMVNAIMVSFVAGAGAGVPPAGPGVTFPSLEELERPSGLMAGLAAASSMLGVVTLSLWAVVTAGDYSSGLVRLLVAAEPRRWPLLAGKVLALVIVTAVATTVAAAVNVLAVMPAAATVGVDTSAWGRDLPAVVLGGWANLFLALIVWGVLGMVIAVLTRSAAVAITAGVGYVLVIESLVRMVADAPSEWLLGSTLGALASGGSSSLDYGTALVLALAYVTLGLVLAGVVFARRDVTDCAPARAAHRVPPVGAS